MYNYLSLALFALGLILLFSPNSILSTSSTYYETLHENSKIIAIICLVASYYFYTLTKKANDLSPLLPSYDEATSVSS